jgi:oligopeptidase B
VQYWEPAKWVAKLRTTKTDNNLLLFKTEMKFGHGGASGRFEALKETALEYAFLLKTIVVRGTGCGVRGVNDCKEVSSCALKNTLH